MGHEPIIGLGGTTLVFNNKKELLLNLRKSEKDYYFEYPNGDKMESRAKAIIYKIKDGTIKIE